MAPRIHRLTDLIARILGKDWDRREQGRRGSAPQQRAERTGPGGDPRLRRWPETPAARNDRSSTPSRSGAAPRPQDDPIARSAAPAGSAGPAGRAAPTRAPGEGDAGGRGPGGIPGPQRPGGPGGPEGLEGLPGGGADTAGALDLDRVQSMITGPMGYSVRRHVEDGHPCLLGSWDDFPFVIEIPQGHEGWLLVSGDWQDPAPASQRDEIAASANDWNRDKFFPTVGIIDGPVGPRVRATYMMDMSAGITDGQLRLHLNTALSACTQALSAVAPLLPEI